MIVLLICLGILFLISLFLLLILISNLEIEINKLWFDSTNEKGKKLEDYLIYIKLKLLDKITWIKIKIDKEKIKKSKIKKLKIFSNMRTFADIKKIILENKKEILSKENIKYIKQLKIKQLKSRIKISTTDCIITSYITAILASLISIILAKNISKYDKSKYHYKITPIYENKAIFKIKLNCIINVKMVHIINTIYVILKKRRDDENEGTSNRSTYVWSNE